MEDEVLTIYNSEGKQEGVNTRKNAHRYGLWHSVVHVWMYGIEQDQTWMYLQKRSLLKKDYAGLFDITTAGHIDAGETHIQAALRECQEEIGISMEEALLQYLGTTKEAVFHKNFTDKEIAYIYLYPIVEPNFHIGEEVDSMWKVKKEDVLQFANDKRCGLPLYTLDGKKNAHLVASQLCQHASHYYEFLLAHMGK